MNYKTSGSKSVVVKLNKLGQNKLPFVEDLKDRTIKYIDFLAVTYLPESADPCVPSNENLFLTLSNKVGNKQPFANIPMSQFDIEVNYGFRTPICDKISLQNSYITCTSEKLVGKSVLLVFHYDDYHFSQRNSTNDVAINAFEVPILSNVRPNIFPDNRTMVNKRFRELIFTDTQQTPEFNKTISVEESKGVYITLRNGNYSIVDQLPLYILYAINKAQKLVYANILFVFTNSFITVGGAGTNKTVLNKSVFLNAAYENK